MQVDTAESWTHLQELVFTGSWNASLARFRSAWVFRGTADASMTGDTALVRLGGSPDELEPHLLRNFMKYARRDVREANSLWHWLSVARHHGLPTRLLDWTYSPLVAMHFATADVDDFGVDGSILAVDYERAHRLLPQPLLSELDREGANSFTAELLARVVESLEQYDRLADAPFLLFFEPPSLDDRIVNQFALFSMMSSPAAGLDAWLAEHPDLCRKIILPAALKWEIRDKLDQCNITERVLFPGLDGLSLWLRRHYMPKDQPPGARSTSA